MNTSRRSFSRLLAFAVVALCTFSADAMKTAVATRNAQLDTLTTLLNTGTLRIYSGTEPSTPETALSGNTLLAQLTFGNPAFGSASSGVATSNAITSDSSADATGTATFFRCLKSDGTTVVYQGTVGTSGSDLNLNSVAISSGAAVGVSSLTVTLPQ